MRTKLIDGKQLRPDDQKILATLTNEARDEAGGNIMVIGFRNDAGQIYRVANTVGLGEFMAVVNGIGALGLTDELADETGMREGCDAIFS